MSEAFRNAAEARLREAACLRRNGNPVGAAYLAGYVIECRLKYFLQLQGKPFPRSGRDGHDLWNLWRESDLPKKDIHGFKRAFLDVWDTGIRYRTALDSEHDTEDLLHGAQQLALYLHRRIKSREGKRRRRRN